MMILGKRLVSNAHHQKAINLIASQLPHFPLHRCTVAVQIEKTP